MLIRDVENLDRILDELEELAQSDLASARFFPVLVERLRLTVQAKSTALLLALPDASWLAIASSGEPAPFAARELTDRLAASQTIAPALLNGQHGSTAWYAVPLRHGKFTTGCLWIWLPDTPPEQALSGFVELLTAFAEVAATRQTVELEGFLESYWERIQTLCRLLLTTRSLDEAQATLVGGLVPILHAARVSLVTRSPGGAWTVRAISGVPNSDPRSATTCALRELAREQHQMKTPLLRQRPEERYSPDEIPALPAKNEDGLFHNLICLQLDHGQTRDGLSTIVLEYATYADMLNSASKLPQLLPTVAATWTSHSRWLRIPSWLRRVCQAPVRVIGTTAIKWLLIAAVLSAGVWLLVSPYPLIVEAEGALEPAIRRDIHATADGYVDQLLVADGQTVSVGQALAQLRSPTLELQIEQTEGELRSVIEESSGLRIAMNQLDPVSPELLNNQSRMAAQIAELAIRQESLQQQRQLLQQERERLRLASPIEGQVVAKDIQQQLDRRPVQRGDALFSIVDLKGPWQIRVQVADRDAGYMLRHYASKPDAETHREVEYVLDRDPQNRLPAEVKWISEQVENQHGQGCYVEVRATSLAPSTASPHAGAGVRAYFRCGEQPLWFVWCRPLIEAAQRRLWFRSPDSE